MKPETNPKHTVYLTNVIRCLEELADREIQERLWLSDGVKINEVGSLSECITQLFDDSGLGWALERRVTGLGPEIESTLMDLEQALDEVSDDAPRATIDNPAMIPARELAALALSQIRNSQVG